MVSLSSFISIYMTRKKINENWFTVQNRHAMITIKDSPVLSPPIYRRIYFCLIFLRLKDKGGCSGTVITSSDAAHLSILV